jgi:hypothetical protein
VLPYLQFIKQDPNLRKMILGVIQRQVKPGIPPRAWNRLMGLLSGSQRAFGCLRQCLQPR